MCIQPWSAAMNCFKHWTVQWQKLGFGLPRSTLTPIRQAKTSLDKDQWPEKPFQPFQHYLTNNSTDRHDWEHHGGWNRAEFLFAKRYWKVFLQYTLFTSKSLNVTPGFCTISIKPISTTPLVLLASVVIRESWNDFHTTARELWWKVVICQCKNHVWNYSTGLCNSFECTKDSSTDWGFNSQ